jgi:hypothetical protein
MHKFLFYNQFIICLHMFLALCVHHQEVKSVLYSSAIITPVGGRPVYRLRVCALSWLLTKMMLKVSSAATDCIVFAFDFIHLTLDKVLRLAVVMNHWVVQNATTFVTRRTTTSFPIRILHYRQ